MNVSGCVFIRNNMEGAFAMFESVASFLPFVDDYTIMDLGSTDGTLQICKEIAEANPRIRLVEGKFPEIDAGAFATLANDLVAMCPNDAVLYHQADEVPHPDLLKLMAERFSRGEYDLSFWRVQYRDNFQKVKWFPHLVHRVGMKEQFNFVNDGMSTDRTWSVPLCSDYGGEFFPKWGQMGNEGIKPYVHQMLMDVSMVGGFLENIPTRRALHAPFWHEEPHIEGLPASQWMERERKNPAWTKTESPFDLPPIMRWHVGKVRYELRPELFKALKEDRTRDLL